MSKAQKIGVIGAGAWGTALAQASAAAGHNVVLWGRNEAAMNAMQTTRQNASYLPDLTLATAINATAKFEDLAESDILLLVTPAQTTADIAHQLDDILAKPTPVVLCSKGILRDSLSFPSQALTERCKHAIPAVLSGPSFAVDVMAGLPTAVTLAARSENLAIELAETLSSPTFRLYHSNDLIGAQIGGAVKNVLAIACGIVAGKQLGASAHAALTARGFAEMTRLGIAMGAKQETMMGLSGLGDLILTCSSPQSRNMALGIALGKHANAADVLARQTKLAEGALTAPALLQLAQNHSIDMPICAAVAAILNGAISVDAAITELLKRPLKRDGA
jgi:glycerol-3-phosphate dehydrogenase (NAD(P)+)